MLGEQLRESPGAQQVHFAQQSLEAAGQRDRYAEWQSVRRLQRREASELAFGCRDLEISLLLLGHDLLFDAIQEQPGDAGRATESAERRQALACFEQRTMSLLAE